ADGDAERRQVVALHAHDGNGPGPEEWSAGSRLDRENTPEAGPKMPLEMKVVLRRAGVGAAPPEDARGERAREPNEHAQIRRLERRAMLRSEGEQPGRWVRDALEAQAGPREGGDVVAPIGTTTPAWTARRTPRRRAASPSSEADEHPQPGLVRGRMRPHVEETSLPRIVREPSRAELSPPSAGDIVLTRVPTTCTGSDDTYRPLAHGRPPHESRRGEEGGRAQESGWRQVGSCPGGMSPARARRVPGSRPHSPPHALGPGGDCSGLDTRRVPSSRPPAYPVQSLA